VALPLIEAPNLKEISNLRHGFTTRAGGVSSGMFASLNLGWATGDDDDLVQENYRRLATVFSIAADRLLGVRQMHGTQVLKIGPGDRAGDIATRSADALITDRPGTFLTVRVADCLPILLADPNHQAVGAVHAGWRGTLEGTLSATIQAMKKEFGSQPGDLRMAIGPGITISHYEVSLGIGALLEEKTGLKKGESARTEQGVQINLAAINRRQAIGEGLSSDRIWNSDLCTFSDAKQRFFSYRRDGKRTGRCVGVFGWVA